MKIPLNSTRPSKGDYYVSLKELVIGLKSLNSEKIYSMLLFGSVVDDSFIPGRSDIDLCLILDSEVITDKNLLISLGDIVKKIVKLRNIDLELNIYDKKIMEDSRFFTFDKSFEKSFNRGKIFYGKDFRPDLDLCSWFHSEEQKMGFNLRWLRKKFVEAPYNIEENYEEFASEFKTFLQKLKGLEISVSNYTKKNIKNSVIEEMVEIAQDFKKFDRIRRNPELALSYWKIGLTGYEKVIKEIIYSCPRPTKHF